ncbi:MAG: PEP-CTERM sorting domain-containing protein [Phycisphaerae bacterium]|nr:PEP-CTERM sorting domain-containing protein [Gemmatimonadaceae bacterium]
MLSNIFANFRTIRRVATVSAVATSLLGMTVPATASAQVVDFETLGYGPACSWSGSSFSSLDGKAWGGFHTLDLNNLATKCGRTSGTGYSSLLPAHVGNVIGFSGTEAWLSSFHPFRLNSMVAGAGWQNTTSLTLSFYLNTQLMSTSTLTLNTYQTGATVYTGFYTGPTDYIGFAPDYSNGVDVFNSYAESCAGAGPQCEPETYKTWFVDNLDFSPMTVTVTPEPASVVLMGFGLAALAGAVRRRRRA